VKREGQGIAIETGMGIGQGPGINAENLREREQVKG